jgi:hypothetical protein
MCIYIYTHIYKERWTGGETEGENMIVGLYKGTTKRQERKRECTHV